MPAWSAFPLAHRTFSARLRSARRFFGCGANSRARSRDVQIEHRSLGSPDCTGAATRPPMCVQRLEVRTMKTRSIAVVGLLVVTLGWAPTTKAVAAEDVPTQ